jgi:hypothetical protein
MTSPILDEADRICREARTMSASARMLWAILEAEPVAWTITADLRRDAVAAILSQTAQALGVTPIEHDNLVTAASELL